jgi:hypothetical protein
MRGMDEGPRGAGPNRRLGSWVDGEIAEGQLPDKRLARRLRQVFDQMGGAMGQTIPRACQDWANTKAAYRFFSNGRVNEQAILKGHFEASRNRVALADGPILVLQDTTEFSFQREKTEAIGVTKVVNSGRDKAGRPRLHTVCGVLMHSSLAVTIQGVPLGLTAVKFWTRDKFRGTAALKRKINPTRVPIETKESYRWLENLRQSDALIGEPGRCVHVGDRESDIYELFCLASELETSFLVRVQTDRLAGAGDHTVAAEMADEPPSAVHVIEVRDAKGAAVAVTLDVKFRTIDVLPPVGKRRRYPSLKLTYIRACERDQPLDRDRVDWKLVTNLPVRSAGEAIEKLSWYALRWKIEVFHKILKSGCRAEQSKLRTAERLANLLSVFCILSWRVFWITMSSRATPEAAPDVALTSLEVKILDRLVSDKRTDQAPPRDLAFYAIKIARLGGYLNRGRDPPPGNMVVWRGMTRLTDIALGLSLANELVGN